MSIARFALVVLSVFLPASRSFAADAKWIHMTSPHFELYTSESEGDAKSALSHLEATRAFFLAATHSHDPGGQSVRIVAFHTEGDYAKYKPAEVRSAKAYGVATGASGQRTIASLGLKPDMLDQVFREYTQLALDDSAPPLPYWFRAGLSTVYSTLKPADNGMNLGAAPRSSFRNGEVADVDLNLLFGAGRDALLASRDKAAVDFNTTTISTGSNNGALATAGSRDPGGSSAAALSSIQSTLAQSQDFARASWMLVHMLIFQQEYRPKFGEFMRTLATGVETGTAFNKVYSAPLSKVQADLILYSKQTGLMVMTAPFKIEKLAAPEVRPAAKEELDQVLAALNKR